MSHRTTLPSRPPALPAVPPPRRRPPRALPRDAVQVVTRLGLLPLVTAAVAVGARRPRGLPAGRGRGRPRTYSDASLLLIALVARLWHLSTREVCLWLDQWPALAAACGLPPGRVIHPAHLARRLQQLGPYHCWRLYLALVQQAIRTGLLRGRDVALDSTLLAAWTPTASDAAWSFPAPKGRVFGYKLHLLLDRAARLPIVFLLSPANRNHLPFAYPLLRFARFVLALPIHVVRADGAYWGRALVRFIVTVLGARPIIPFNPKKQPLARVRHLVGYRLSYAARAVIARFFAAAKRYYRLDTYYACGYAAVLRQVTLTGCAILVVALAAQQAGAPELRLSPPRVLPHYLPIEPAL